MENEEKQESSFCSNCRKVTIWKKGRSRSLCSSCKTVFPCGHKCSHWDCMEARGEAKPDENGILRKILVFLIFFSLVPLTVSCDSNPNPSNLSPDPFTPSPDARTTTGPGVHMGRPEVSAQPFPGVDAGPAATTPDAGVMRSDLGTGSQDAEARDTIAAFSDVPPVLQPKPDAGCASPNECPISKDEGGGIFSLWGGWAKPPAGCVALTRGSYAAAWYQDYGGKRYLFSFYSCATGAAQPSENVYRSSLAEVHADCGGVNPNSPNLNPEWKAFLGDVIQVVGTTDAARKCGGNRGICKNYVCVDAMGKILK